MKKILLLLTSVVAFGFINLNAQIVNGSFESWKIDTFDFAAGTVGSLPADTTVFNDPVGWTSSNYLTYLDSVGHVIFTSQDSTQVQAGHQYSVKMITDSVHVPVIPNFPLTRLTIPGFAVLGTFPLKSISFTSSSVISPLSIKGAGQSMTQRLASFSGYYNYAPVMNPNTNAYDTCIMWAVLRKGPDAVANAIFKSNVPTNGYAAFSVNFDYVSCELPDTLVILIASSVPNVSSFLGGGHALVPGSTLYIDSLTYDTLANNYVFAPFARNDISNATVNVPDTIDVLANDTDCAGSNHLDVTLVGTPNHGQASVITTGPYKNKIVYVSSVGFLGLDSIYYQDKNNQTNETANALVQIFVQPATGISQVNQLHVAIYPVPAANELNIQFENPGNSTAKIYDMLGNLVLSGALMNDKNVLNLNNIANGFYCLTIENEHNELLARNTFVVTR